MEKSINLYPCTFIPADDLWVISCYYNPNKYTSRERNFDVFYETLKTSKINFIIIESADSDENFYIPECKNDIRIKNESILWQKERLLNIAIAQLPPTCKKVAWLDCDVLFANPLWAVETSAKLDRYKIVQPFSEAIWLPSDHHFYNGTGLKYPGFAYISNMNPGETFYGRFADHGHTGFAWAAQKECLIEHGLYEGSIAGGADHYMAHAFCGDWDGACIKGCFKGNKMYYRHFVDWARSIYPHIKSSISYVPGTLLHLWHGEIMNRNYYKREVSLSHLHYNPYTDLHDKNKKAGLKFNKTSGEIENWVKEYFQQRQEDVNFK